MWNRRSLFLYIRVRVLGPTRFRIRLFLALYALPQLLLCCDALLSMLPGHAGEKVRLPFDIVYAFLLELQYSAPQTFASVDVQAKKERVLVELKTCGLQGAGIVRSKAVRLPFGASFFARLLSCIGGLLLAIPLFPGNISFLPALFGGMALTLLYIFLRPLLQCIALPFNLLLFGLVTPLADALLFLLADVCTAGMQLSYWQGALTSLLIGLCYAPFAACKRRALSSLRTAA